MRPGTLAQRSVAGPAAPAKPNLLPPEAAPATPAETTPFAPIQPGQDPAAVLAARNRHIAEHGVSPETQTIADQIMAQAQQDFGKTDYGRQVAMRNVMRDEEARRRAAAEEVNATVDKAIARLQRQPRVSSLVDMSHWREGPLALQARQARQEQLQRKQEEYARKQQLDRAWGSFRAFGSQGGLREPPPAYREYLAQAKAYREGRGPWPGPWRGSISDRPLTASSSQAVQQPARQLAQASRPSPKSVAGGSSATQPTPAAVQAIQQQLTSDPAWTAIPAWAKQRYLQNYRAGRTQMNPQQALQYWQQHYANRLAV